MKSNNEENKKSHYQESPLCVCPNPDCRAELGNEWGNEWNKANYNTKSHEFECEFCGWSQKHPCFMCAYNLGEKKCFMCQGCCYEELKRRDIMNDDTVSDSMKKRV